MQNQNYKNHHRYLLLYHVIAPIVLLSVIIGSVVNLIHAAPDNKYSASLILVISLLLVVIGFYSRSFALKSQDRAIRAEENFRHFVLTGKPLDSTLTMSQVIALRFAPDEEFIALAERAAREKLDSKSIKEAIINWRGDYHRA